MYENDMATGKIILCYNKSLDFVQCNICKYKFSKNNL